MKTQKLNLKKEVVSQLTDTQLGGVRGGGTSNMSDFVSVDHTRETFGTVCLCASDNMYCPALTYYTCPEPPVTGNCATGDCPSCGCATYDCAAPVSDGVNQCVSHA